MRDIFVSKRQASVHQNVPPAASMEHFPLSVDIVSRQVDRLAASVQVISDIEVFGLNQKRVSRPASDLDCAVLGVKREIGNLNFAECLCDDRRTPHKSTVTVNAHADGFRDNKIAVSIPLIFRCQQKSRNVC